jgi:hypothetical protein
MKRSTRWISVVWLAVVRDVLQHRSSVMRATPASRPTSKVDLKRPSFPALQRNVSYHHNDKFGQFVDGRTDSGSHPDFLPPSMQMQAAVSRATGCGRSGAHRRHD